MPLTPENSLCYDHNKNPKCPHCDNDIDIAQYDLYQLYDDSDIHEIDCPCCGKKFKVDSCSEWTFSTYEQDF